MDDRRRSGLWDRNDETGFYEQIAPTSQAIPEGPYEYYQPPDRRTSQDQKRTFSERSTTASQSTADAQNGMRRTESQKQRRDPRVAAKLMRQDIPVPVHDLVNSYPDSTSEQLATTQHVNSTRLPGSSHRDPLRIDPDYVPLNLRSKTWSPDPMSPKSVQPAQSQPKPRQALHASNISEPRRHGSVSDRSPLQKLEVRTKEEKRALVEQAEHRARQKSLSSTSRDEGQVRRQDTRSGENKRAVSDGVNRRTSEPQRRIDKSRRLSDVAPASAGIRSPVSPIDGSKGAERSQDAQDALKREVSPSMEDHSRKQSTSAPFSTKPKPLQQPPEHLPDSSQRRKDSDHQRASTDLGRTKSGRYQHRARDAGFAGATAAASATVARDAGAERGKAAYERRKSQTTSESPIIPVSPDQTQRERTGLGIGRSESKKIQKRSVGGSSADKQLLQGDRMASGSEKKERRAAEAYQHPDPIPPQAIRTSRQDSVKYSMPPQTAAAQEAKEQVGFHEVSPVSPVSNQKTRHRFGNIFHRQDHERRVYQESSKPLDEWRRAAIARLTLEDLEFEQTVTASSKGEHDAAWWEKNGRRSSSDAKRKPNLSQYDGPYEEEAICFQPMLFLKCGPLLRFTGIRKETHTSSRTGKATEKEIWHGSIMIVTEDNGSDLSSTPTLRLFAQPMDLLQKPPQHSAQSGQEMLPEFEDPVAGQVKLSRMGRALYVRPVHDIESGVDLSREENNQGLYAATRTPVLGPQSITGPDGRQSRHITFQDKSRIKKRDGEKAGRYRDIKAVRLHTERNATFWRFNIEIELGSKQHRVAYRINKAPAIGFWVPPRGETMNIMFHSCNGFSMSVDPNTFSGPDPLWRDVLNRHQSRPFHVMIGGGDQVYNDIAQRDTELFKEWLQTKNPEHKHRTDFTPEMQDELETFYFDRYAMWFSQGLFAMANSQIPMVNIWDDHDIIDGYGSYPHHFMSSRVFTGLGAVAFKYYMLFQHQSLVAETEKEEPSWLLGKSPGPYINELSRSVFLSLGKKVAFLGLDCRTERMRDEILSQETYDHIFDRVHDEVVKGETKHLIVLLGVPIAYPRLNFLENILTSRAMDPIKAIGRTGMLGGFLNNFDGGVEILDDLDDHWTAKHHKGERNWFIRELQDLAAEKSIRVTILGGDVHLAAVGQFYSNKKLGITKDRDHRYMPNVVSSAIVNTPPPTMMADVLNKRNKVHHLDAETDEDMIPMFDHDVDGSRRNNKHLLPRRNYCTIREFVPGSTPPTTPSPEPQTPASATFGQATGGADGTNDRRFPPGSMKRTLSLTRGPANLVRRLSGSGRSKNPPLSLTQDGSRPGEMQRANSLGSRPPTGDGASYFPQPSEDVSAPRPGFHRRPTNLSIKEARRAAAKGGADATEDGREPGHVDLEHGLDISLCMEIDQRDPGGSTVPYRLLVPALTYEAPPQNVNGAESAGIGAGRQKRISLMDRLWRNRKREEPGLDGTYEQDEEYSDDDDESVPPTAEEKERHRADAANALGLSNTGRGAGIGHTNSEKGVSNRNQPTQHTSVGAYNKGFNLSNPPIGQHALQHHPPPTQQRPQAVQEKNDPYPQSAQRRARAAQQPSPPQSDGSLTPSDFDDDREDYIDEPSAQQSQRSPPVRRGSKAERFFGIGDAGQGGTATRTGGSGGLWGPDGKLALGRQQQQQQQQPRQSSGADGVEGDGTGVGRVGSVKKKPGWMIWK